MSANEKKRRGAASPLDGRYEEISRPIAKTLSEAGLIEHRWLVECQWLTELVESRDVGIKVSAAQKKELAKLAKQDWPELIEAIVSVEQKTRHDLRALTEVMKERLDALGLAKLKPWVHFGCTSWDINNLAYACMLTKVRNELLSPKLSELQTKLSDMASEHAKLPMLGRTHCQPASPTTFGKELNVYALRVLRQLENLSSHVFDGKWNGAVGNFNSFVVALPEVPWLELSRQMVSKMGLRFQAVTTQVEPYDGMVEFFDIVIRINRILLDLAQDLSIYAGLGHLKLAAKKAEVGSSTMPHKINPIDFENAEGNLAISNSLLGCFGHELQISRLQRDLSDSTVLRNIGVALGHAMVGWTSINNGLDRLSPCAETMSAELDANWQVLGEAVQTVLRSLGDEQAYEKLHEATRGKGPLDAEEYFKLVRRLVPEGEMRERLLALSPGSYLGLAAQLADSAADGTANPKRKR